MSKVKAFVVAFRGLLGVIAAVVYMVVAAVLLKRSECVIDGLKMDTWPGAFGGAVLALMVGAMGLGVLCGVGYWIAVLYEEGATNYKKRCKELNKSGNLLEWVKNMDPAKVEMFKAILEKDGDGKA